MATKFTPSHFPRGTVISTSLYELNDDGTYSMSYTEDGDAEFTVDHVKTTPSTDDGCLIVTTAVKHDPVFEGDDRIVFHSCHVDKIISMGKEMIIRHAPGFEPNAFSFHDGCDYWKFDLLLRILAFRIDPARPVATDKMVPAMKKMGVVRTYLDKDRRYGLCERYLFSMKKVKKWVKQNFNRYIVTEAEKRANEKARDESIRKDMDEDWDRDFDERCVVPDEILNADFPPIVPFYDTPVSDLSQPT